MARLPLDALPANPGRLLKFYLAVTSLRPSQIAIPLLLSLASAAADGTGMALLLPLSQGMSANSFAFVWSLPVFRSVQPLISPRLLDSPRADTMISIALVGLIFATRLARLGIDYARDVYRRSRDEAFAANVRTATFGRMLNFGVAYFEQRAVGQIHLLIEWSTAGLALLREAEDFIANAVKLAVKVTVMIALSPILTLVMAGAFPLIQYLLRLTNRKALEIAQDVAAAAQRAQRDVFDILSTIPLVKVYSREDETRDAFGTVITQARDATVRQERLRLLHVPIQEGVILVGMVVALAIAAWQSGNFRPGDLAVFCAFLLVAQQSMPHYMALNRVRLAFIEKAPVLRALDDLQDDVCKYIVPSGKKVFIRLTKGIELRKLRFGYVMNGVTLHDLDAFIPAGKMTAIVGETGAGKSTLVDLLMRLYDVHPGMIFLDGVDIREMTLLSLHNQFAVVSQDTWLLNRSLRDNLIFGLGRTPSDDNLRQILESACLPVSNFPAGLDTEIGDRGVRLSGGERQRLSIARAILRIPEVLILDEATSAIDSVTEQRLQGLLSRMAQGRTVISVAHRLSTIRHADQILVMEGGRIVESGTWHELVAKKGKFFALLEAQTHQLQPAAPRMDIGAA